MKRTCIALLIAAVCFIYGYLIGHNAGYGDAAEAYTETYEAIIDKYRQCYEDVRDELIKTMKGTYGKERQNNHRTLGTERCD